MKKGSLIRRCQPVAWVLTAVLVSPVAGGAWAQARFTYSTDGSEVTDGQTGMIWRRCSEGQSYSGDTCIGSAAQFTHEGALVHAKAQTGWRLPNIKELASIVDTDRYSPSIDTIAFPGTPAYAFWSSTPHVDDASRAWYVSFFPGSAFTNDRKFKFHVRLVR